MRQGKRRRRVFFAALLGAAFGTVLCAGCKEKDIPVDSESQVEYGRLPGLRGSPDSELREELSRIEAEQGTPEQMTKPAEISDLENVAAGLQDLLRSSELDSVREALEGFFPTGKFEFNLLVLNKALKFAKKHEDRRNKARQALTRSNCDFGLRHIDGWVADMKFVDVARICGLLEVYHAAECLFVNRSVVGAIESLQYQFRLAECLGAEKRVLPRLEAASIREEALRVLQAILDSGLVDRAHLDQLRELVHHQLKKWPPDADMWIGDRALGMYVYEVVRDGGLLSLLTGEEMGDLNKDGLLEEMVELAPQMADVDELFYLQTMRDVIEQCEKPYHSRADLSDKVEAALAERRTKPDYPVIADRLLLRDLGVALEKQAEDRVRMEAWAVALDLATGHQSSNYVNTMTGKPFRIERKPDKISVWLDASTNEKAPPDIVVPVPGS
ncbi:MAG: hypothetical protein JW818_09920 [Pirellulales bacterium]|nr:hypothetical protein [Pirellulales bacterium]